jgi:glycosyltransferase involved in cell wall biosynthesis
MRAVFVGDGQEANAIRAACPGAEITGWLDSEGVQARLSRARALVFPSLWYEAQGLAAIEALVRGIPVVCGSWCAASEVVEDGVNGVLYDTPDAGALAVALKRVSTLPVVDGSALAKAASPERHLSRLLEIYEAMLARSR